MSTSLDTDPRSAGEMPDAGTIGHRNGDSGGPAMDDGEDVVGEDIEVVIPNVPPDVLAVIDNKARNRGISRGEFIKELMVKEREAVGHVTMEDLKRLAETYADLKDPEIMRGAYE